MFSAIRYLCITDRLHGAQPGRLKLDTSYGSLLVDTRSHDIYAMRLAASYHVRENAFRGEGGVPKLRKKPSRASHFCSCGQTRRKPSRPTRLEFMEYRTILEFRIQLGSNPSRAATLKL